MVKKKFSSNVNKNHHMYFNEVFSWQAFCEVFETTQLKIGLFLITQRRLYVITCDQSNVIILSFLGKLSNWENIHIPKYCYSYIKSKNTTWPRRYINSPSERSTVLRLNFERTNLFLNFSFQQLGIKIFLSKIRCTHLINRPSPSTTHTKLKSVTLFLSPLFVCTLSICLAITNQLRPSSWKINWYLFLSHRWWIDAQSNFNRSRWKILTQVMTKIPMNLENELAMVVGDNVSGVALW